jgi:hypothetical protein
MGTFNKTIQKEITFFWFDDFTSKTIDDLICFCSTYGDVLISSININLNNKNKPISIELATSVGPNVVRIEIKPKTYYFYKGRELNSVENVNDVNWW